MPTKRASSAAGPRVARRAAKTRHGGTTGISTGNANSNKPTPGTSPTWEPVPNTKPGIGRASRRDIARDSARGPDAKAVYGYEGRTRRPFVITRYRLSTAVDRL